MMNLQDPSAVKEVFRRNGRLEKVRVSISDNEILEEEYDANGVMSRVRFTKRSIVDPTTESMEQAPMIVKQSVRQVQQAPPPVEEQEAVVKAVEEMEIGDEVPRETHRSGYEQYHESTQWTESSLDDINDNSGSGTEPASTVLLNGSFSPSNTLDEDEEKAAKKAAKKAKKAAKKAKKEKKKSKSTEPSDGSDPEDSKKGMDPPDNENTEALHKIIPSDDDICFGNATHPGTIACKAAVNAVANEYRNDKDVSSSTLIKAIKKKLSGRTFLVKAVDEQGRSFWREASRKERSRELKTLYKNAEKAQVV